MKEIGELFRSERVRRGWALSDVSEKTSVSVPMLQAIEDGEFGRIGTPLLVRNFIKAYGALLEIDTAPLLEKSGQAIRSCDRQDESIRKYGEWASNGSQRSLTRTLVMVLALALLGAAFFGGAKLLEMRARVNTAPQVAGNYTPPELPPDLPDKQPADTAGLAPGRADQNAVGTPGQIPFHIGTPGGTSAGTGASDSPDAAAQNAEQGRAAGEVPPVGKHIVEMEVNRRTWVTVQVDGKTAFAGVLPSGANKRWEIDKKASVLLGNTTGVKLLWDGATVDFPKKTTGDVRIELPQPNSATVAAPPVRR